MKNFASLKISRKTPHHISRFQKILLASSMLVLMLLPSFGLIAPPVLAAGDQQNQANASGQDAAANGANGANDANSNQGQNNPTPEANDGVSTSSFNVSKYLTAPGQDQKYLKSTNPIASAIIQVINLLVLTIGSVSFLAVVIGGFTYIISHGNENLVNKAKEMITYAIIGLVIAFAAYFIVAFVQGLFYEI